MTDSAPGKVVARRDRSEIDLMIQPMVQYQELMVLPAGRLRLYQSSLPGLLSLTVTTPDCLPAGLRLDKGQAKRVRDEITAWLEAMP